MNEQLTAAQPPFFLATHSASIANAARDYPQVDGLLIDVHSQRMMVTAQMTDGVIVRWVVEAPVGVDGFDERQAQLEKTGLKYV